MNNIRFTAALGVLAAAFAGLDGSYGAGDGGDCPADLSGNMIVNADDLVQLLANWGPCPLGPTCPADINLDGIVNVFDLMRVILCWGPCPCAPLGPVENWTEFVVLDVTDGPAGDAGLLVTHVYATGPLIQPGDPLGALGNTTITAVNGTFFQAPLGTDVPPLTLLCGVDPLTCYDTFVTNGYVADSGSAVILAPGFSMDTTTVSGSWLTNPDDPNRLAVSIPGTGQFGVLVAQLTLIPTLGPSSVGFTGPGRLFDGRQATLGPGLTASGEGLLTGINFPGTTGCLADCGDGNGEVDTIDFLALLAEWGLVDTPCDLDGGGVDTVDFLQLLAAWGPCP